MKLFEIREFIDGGPNDRGNVIGYVKASSIEELKEKRTNYFIDYIEISEERFLKLKEEVENKLKMFQNVL